MRCRAGRNLRQNLRMYPKPGRPALRNNGHGTAAGEWVGNSAEVYEAVEVLSGRGPSDTVNFASSGGAMLEMSGRAKSRDEARTASKALDDGSALDKFAEMIRAQNGDASVVGSH